MAGRPIPGAWKMKWHNFGPGEGAAPPGRGHRGSAGAALSGVGQGQRRDRQTGARRSSRRSVNRIHSGRVRRSGNAMSLFVTTPEERVRAASSQSAWKPPAFLGPRRRGRSAWLSRPGVFELMELWGEARRSTDREAVRGGPRRKQLTMQPKLPAVSRRSRVSRSIVCRGADQHPCPQGETPCPHRPARRHLAVARKAGDLASSEPHARSLGRCRDGRRCTSSPAATEGR